MSTSDRLLSINLERQPLCSICPIINKKAIQSGLTGSLARRFGAASIYAPVTVV